jgi:hypothetical protein
VCKSALVPVAEWSTAAQLHASCLTWFRFRLQVCKFYLLNGKCDYRRECRWNHPNLAPLNPKQRIFMPNGASFLAEEALQPLY